MQACGQKVLCILLLEEQIHPPWQSHNISEFSAGVTFLSPTGSHPYGSRQKPLGGCDLLLSAPLSKGLPLAPPPLANGVCVAEDGERLCRVTSSSGRWDAPATRCGCGHHTAWGRWWWTCKLLPGLFILFKGWRHVSKTASR